MQAPHVQFNTDEGHIVDPRLEYDEIRALFQELFVRLLTLGALLDVDADPGANSSTEVPDSDGWNGAAG